VSGAEVITSFSPVRQTRPGNDGERLQRRGRGRSAAHIIHDPVLPPRPRLQSTGRCRGLTRIRQFRRRTTNTISGGTETITTTIQQGVTWKDSVWTLNYNKIQDDNSITNFSSSSLTRMKTIFLIGNFPKNCICQEAETPPRSARARGQPAPSTQSNAVIVHIHANPLQSGATISYRLRGASHTTLTVCDLSGKTVATIVDEEKPAGVYEARWNAAVFQTACIFCA